MLLVDAINRWGVFVSGCLIWIPIAVWMVAVIHLWVGGDIEAPFALSAIGTGLAIIYFTINPPVDWLSPVLFAATIVTLALFVPIRRLATSHELKEVDYERLERAVEAYEQRPDNVAASLAAAELLFQYGQIGHAIALADKALVGANPAHYSREQRALAEWKALEVRNPSPIPECIRCGTSNAAGTLKCGRCGAPVLVDVVRGKVVPGALMHKLVTAWAVGTLVIVGIPVVFAYLHGSPILLAAGILAVGAIAVLVAVKGRVLES